MTFLSDYLPLLPIIVVVTRLCLGNCNEQAPSNEATNIKLIEFIDLHAHMVPNNKEGTKGERTTKYWAELYATLRRIRSFRK